MDIEKIDIGYKSPVIIVDGFYDNPDEIRKYGLYQEQPDPNQSLLKTIKFFDYYKPYEVK